MNSPLARFVRPGPAGTSETFISRSPFGPATTAIAPAAAKHGTLSAAGDALQRFPAKLARP